MKISSNDLRSFVEISGVGNVPWEETLSKMMSTVLSIRAFVNKEVTSSETIFVHRLAWCI